MSKFGEITLIFSQDMEIPKNIQEIDETVMSIILIVGENSNG